MERAIQAWLSRRTDIPEHIVSLTKKLQNTYVVYGSMILLPSDSIAELQSNPDLTNHDLQCLYEAIASHLKITHIAVNRPIPLYNSTNGGDCTDENQENVLRSPSNFTPLFGDFGPSTCSNAPTHADFDKAFWITAKQNGIYQTWAPRWTMFSRGNVSEKARLLTLPSVVEAVEAGRHQVGAGFTAVDLYVGIGYFAFSYAKAGARKVLGWDLNAWSCEGLRRGAKANKWKAKVLCGDEDAGDVKGAVQDDEVSFLVFNESNERAAAKVERLRPVLPPVRHINCGMLPTSRGSWETAVQVLDARMGGWVHVHENFAVNDIEEKAGEVRQAFQKLLDHRGRGDRKVDLEHINRLKSFAPGVMHVVLDLFIPPSTDAD